MENTALVALSRQIALKRELATISNNIANINTQGFKRGATMFQEYLEPIADGKPFEGLDRDLSYVWDRGTIRDMTQGAVQMTEGEFDFAIEGPGYFVVETPRGERYTRDGSFARNNEGFLVNMSGYRVMGSEGPIEVPEGQPFQVGRDGTMASGADAIGQMRVVTFGAEQQLDHEAGNLFNAEAAPQEDPASRIRQGMIERSNVSGVIEMTRMIDVQRAYQSLANVQKGQDDMRAKAIQTLGRVS